MGSKDNNGQRASLTNVPVDSVPKNDRNLFLMLLDSYLP